MSKDRIGFIGLGLMGGPMAANVGRAGYPLTVYNRTPEKARPLIDQGARAVDTPQAVAEASDVVVTMLTDAWAVEEVLHGTTGLLAGGRPGKVLIDMSTVSPEQSRVIAAGIGVQGWKMLDAPVFGSTGPAREGTLGIMVGGDRALFEAQRPLLETMGKSLFYMGPQGAGAMAKLCFNLHVACQLAALAESMVMAASGGLDLKTMGEVVQASGVISNLLDRKINNIKNNDYRPVFPLRHMHKDLGLMVETAHKLGAPLPVTASVHQLFSGAKSAGHGDEDSIAVFRALAEFAGQSL